MSGSAQGGSVYQVNVSAGGVPKRPVAEGVITSPGVAGDKQAKRGIHGGPYRALCLFPLEEIERLASQGHPVAAGSLGENVTTRGLDWSLVVPGARLRLGASVLIEITGYADPCKAIAGAFSDGNINLVNRRLAPNSSRVYAQVLGEGTIRPGDSIRFEQGQGATGQASQALQAEGGVRSVAQVSLTVSDLQQAVTFYRDALGARLEGVEAAWGLAFLEVGETRLMLEGPRHADAVAPGGGTLTFGVEDIDGSYRAMRERGVRFDAPPLLQYERDGVAGWMAFFRDPDGNRLALVSEVPSRVGA
jgi:MOSC domain-containing protein YiiM